MHGGFILERISSVYSEEEKIPDNEQIVEFRMTFMLMRSTLWVYGYSPAIEIIFRFFVLAIALQVGAVLASMVERAIE